MLENCIFYILQMYEFSTAKTLIGLAVTQSVASVGDIEGGVGLDLSSGH